MLCLFAGFSHQAHKHLSPLEGMNIFSNSNKLTVCDFPLILLSATKYPVVDECVQRYAVTRHVDRKDVKFRRVN